MRGALAQNQSTLAHSGRMQSVTRSCRVITGVYSPQSHREHRGDAEEAVFQNYKIRFSPLPSVSFVAGGTSCAGCGVAG